MALTHENLTSRVINGLRVQAIARRKPLAWNVICTTCGAEQVHKHTSLQNGFATCGNTGCGRTSSTSPSSMSVASAEAGIWTADSTAARAFQQSQQISQPVNDPAAAKRRTERMEADRLETERLTTQYKRYFFHQLNYDDGEPMSLQQWFNVGDAARERILSIVAKDDNHGTAT